MEIQNKQQRLTKLFMIMGIIFIAFNLRPAITSVGPLVGDIRDTFHISNGAISMITTLPLLAFALFSILSPLVAKRWGNEMTVLVGLFLILSGIVIRSSGYLSLLFVGTGLVGIGIAIGNTLLPAIVKNRFPNKVGLMTSIYSTSMGLCAAIASGVSIPLAHGLNLGWQKALLCLGVIALVAIIIWFPHVVSAKNKGNGQLSGISMRTLFRSPIAWQVTLFLGLQSILFYGPITWLPEILIDRGISIETAGWLLGFMQFCSLPANFITPVIAGKLKSQQPIVAVVGLFYLMSIVGLIVGGGKLLMIIWILLLGIAQGACISLALTLINLRTRNAVDAAQLSGMAQSIGYLLTSVGPFFIGVLFDFTHSWTMPLLFLFVIAVGTILAGLGASRPIFVGESEKT